MFANRRSRDISISMARFANVAFSDGSLLHGFDQRLKKKQPLVAPNDIKRYFITPQESGEICLMSCIFGENRDIFFPKLSEALHLITFAEIAERYLEQLGYKPFLCKTEEEARGFFKNNTLQSDENRMLTDVEAWPCLFTSSDTTGEKDFEEFFTENEILDMDRFDSLGVIKNKLNTEEEKLIRFEAAINEMRRKGNWNKDEIVDLFNYMIPKFDHKETGKYLDSKM